jgi:catecholate siderophore receptor
MRDHSPAARGRLLDTVSYGALALAAFSLPTLLFSAGAGAEEQAPIEVPAISVEGEGQAPANTLKSPSTIDRLPGTVQDTPQTINTITPEIMQQQNTTTLDQVLRNVPGITVSVGEGGGGMNGDQFRIRGFEAKGDIYVDGLRDFGVYTRDSFNYETVQVLKGPSSESFGMGTTGGVINTVTKTPFLGTLFSGTQSFGNGPLFRTTADVNYQVDDTTAVRLNALLHRADVVDRDEIHSRRWAIAPSVGLGLGTDTTYTVSYMHLHDDRIPDYGVPILTAPGNAIGRPAPEYGIDRSNFYGKTLDRDHVTVDMVTGKGTHKMSDWLSLYNDTRIAFYSRDMSNTPPQCNAACSAAFFAGGNPMIQNGGGGGVSYLQDTFGTQNITTGVAKFDTQFLRHELVAGLDLFYQDDDRKGFAYSPPKNTTFLIDPDPFTSSSLVRSGVDRYSTSKNLALFLSDRIWLTEEVSVLGGVRWDRYWTDYRLTSPTADTTKLSANSSQVNPKGSLIYEPTKSQTYYFSYAKSSNPPGQFIANGPNPLSATNKDLEPEKNTIYEIGAKVDVIEDRLGIYLSLFRVEKNNAKQTDPVTGDIVQSGDKQRNQGLEFGITGKPVERVTVNFNYTYMNSKTLDSTNVNNLDKEVQFVPNNALSLWTTYDVTPAVQLGAGVTYRDSVFLNASNTQQAPYNLSFDALAAYRVTENFRLQVNAYNLADRTNYDAVFSNRVVPAPGRTVVVSLSASF